MTNSDELPSIVWPLVFCLVGIAWAFAYMVVGVFKHTKLPKDDRPKQELLSGWKS